MTCIQCEELISDYLESMLDAQAANSMEAHFAECAACNELLTGVREVMAWGKAFPVYQPRPWVADRIIANTPQVVRETWLDAVVGLGRWLIEPRTAMAIFTATLVLGWLGSLAGVNIRLSDIQDPGAVYYRAEGYLNRAYGEAVQRYYKTPLVAEIQFQLERLREIS